MAPKPQETTNQQTKSNQQIISHENSLSFGEMFAKQTEQFQNQVSEMRKRQRQFHDKFNADFQKMLTGDNESDIFSEDSHWFKNDNSIMDNFAMNQVENESSQIKEDEQSYQITMDIKNFDPKNLNVKLVENNELLVEGTYDEVKEGKTHKQQFKKSYCLPCVTEASNITCKRTASGTLLINIEKDKKASLVNPRKVSIEKSSNSTHEGNYQQHPRSTLNNGQRSSLDEVNRHSPVSGFQNNLPQSAIKPRSIRTIHTHKGPEQVLDTTGGMNSSNDFESGRKDETMNQNGSVNMNNLNMGPLSIQPKDMGSFFGDSFFKDMHGDFHQAVKRVLENSNKMTSNITDDINKYNDLRAFKKSSNNQAVSHTEDETTHKIILDVKGFDKDSMSVKVNEDENLVIEGTFVENNNGKTVKKTFKHFFKISDFDTNKITSALSQDGILTIKVPKKETGIRSYSTFTNRSTSLDEFEQLENQLNDSFKM